MKKIEAIIKRSARRCEGGARTSRRAGHVGERGEGVRAPEGPYELYRGAEYVVDFLPKIKDRSSRAGRAGREGHARALRGGRTARSADGKITVIPVENAIRIRTGESGDRRAGAEDRWTGAYAAPSPTSCGCTR